VPVRPRRRTFRLALILFVLWMAACGPEENGNPSPPPPSGALGPVTPGAAEEAVRGLCDLRTATDRVEAEATFLDRSHATLHVIAAATEVRDRGAAADLLEAKQRVEADLAGGDLRPGFAADVRALIDATRAALAAIGLDAPACPA
jgi:ribosomal protein S18 acetylase RimI-like enzyme